jgi:TolB-like protein/DNA-binding CsgD family transcriptional regulator
MLTASSIAVVSPVGHGTAAPLPEASSAWLPAEKTVAVLPFTDLSDVTGQIYLSDGMAEDLAVELSRFSEILVTGWESSLACRRFVDDIPRIARALAVRYVVGGSVGRTENRLHIAIRLIDTRSAQPVWSGHYEGSMTDALPLQEEIARGIADHLLPKRSRSEPLGAKRLPPRSLEIYDLVQRARWALMQGGDTDDLALISTGIALAREAAQQDPRYAEAQRCLAWGHNLRGELGYFGAEAQADYGAAKEAALRQRELDPLNHSAHALAGHIAMRQMRHGEAMASLRLAHQLKPNDVMTLRWLSWVEANHELPEPARTHGTLSLRLSPCDRTVSQGHWPLALADYVAGDVEACLDHARRAVAMRPRFAVHYIVLAACLAELGEIQEAHYTLAAAQMLNPKLVESRLSGSCYFVRADLTARYVRALRSAAAGRDIAKVKAPAGEGGNRRTARHGVSQPELIPPALASLTPRERSVLALVAQGKSNADIACALTISAHTAKRHIANILTKLDLRTRGAAASLATRYAIV